MMKKNTPTSTFSFSKIYCSLFSHNYLLSKNITDHIKEYTCSHCGKQATINSKGQLEAMTPRLKEINDALAFVHAKKQARVNRDTTFQAAS
jgi:transposase-like protein